MEQLIFVYHRNAGVHRVPAAWLDGFMPSGFRPATAVEVARWHEERDLDPPADTALTAPNVPLPVAVAAPRLAIAAVIDPFQLHRC